MWHGLRSVSRKPSIHLVLRMGNQRCCLSSTTGTQNSSSSSSSTSSQALLKKLIKPFVLKCHPDMAAQHNLPKTAVQVNLKAIQNLNSYIDGAIAFEQGGKYSFPSNHLVEIEFVMSFFPKGTAPAAAQPTTSRRRVELQVPPPEITTNRVSPHVQRQVVKLLRMADLPIPKLSLEEEHDEYNDDELGSSSYPSRASALDEEWMAGQVINQRARGKTAWDRSRDRFMRRVNWNKFDKAYQKALMDAQANLETQGLIRDNPKYRKQLIAKILSHIHFTDSVQPLERLVAYRRLLRLLDEHFDFLKLESFGGYWEDLQISITESRPYNTSSSAMRKRRQRHLETGYQFTIHHDNSVTVQIPVDFQNEELIQELHRNVKDFYEWTQQDDMFGLEGILEDEGAMM